MSKQYDAIIIGGGHNGLVCAAYLARAGKSVLVLERRHLLGGATITEEIFPGFKTKLDGTHEDVTDGEGKLMPIKAMGSSTVPDPLDAADVERFRSWIDGGTPE